MFARKRLLFLIPSMGGGGAERVFSILLRHLDRNRFEPHLAVLRGAGPRTQDIPEDVAVHELAASRARYSVSAIVRLIRKIKPDIVLSTHVRLNLALVVSKPMLPVGIRLLLRETIPPSTVSVNKFLLVLWHLLYRPLYSRADKVVCLSDSMLEEIAVEFRMPRDKLVRIYNPVDVERVRELAEAAPNPYSGPGPQLVAVGRLARQKGYDLLLSALPAVRKQIPGVRLAILGQGELQAELERQARQLGLADAVRFFGFQRNPWPFIKHAGLFVLPSRFEGLPNALLEAAVLERPIVAADCPGAVAELKPYLPAMTLVPPEDPGALARAIIAACTMSSRSAGAGSFSGDVLARFGWQKIVGEYTDMFLS